MESKEQVKLLFRGVDFPSVQLQSFKSYQETEELKVKIDIKPKVFVPKDNKNTFKIIMNVSLSVPEHFALTLTGVGKFELSEEDIEPEIRNNFINANSTAIMFPYVRAFISTLTSNLGKVTTPIILPARFFKGELEEESVEI